MDSRQHRTVTPEGEECSEPGFPTHSTGRGSRWSPRLRRQPESRETVMAMLCPHPFNSHVGAQPLGLQGEYIWIRAFTEVINVK